MSVLKNPNNNSAIIESHYSSNRWETGRPQKSEWHREILVEDAVSIPDEIKVQFVIGEIVKHL